MDIMIESLKATDYPATIDVIKRSITISLGKMYPKVLTDEFCKKYELDKFSEKAKEVDYFVAKEGATVLGVIGLKHNELRTFFVDPDLQGKGVGRKLYDSLEKEAIKRGIQKLTLEGSPLGEPIYLKFGFKKVKTIDKEKVGVKYTDAHMEKDL